VIKKIQETKLKIKNQNAKLQIKIQSRHFGMTFYLLF